MSNVQLLDKTREIIKLLHNNNSSKVAFDDVCAVMADVLRSTSLVISKKGKLLGISSADEVAPITELLQDHVGEFIDSSLNERLLGILSTKENVNLEMLGFAEEGISGCFATAVPIDIAGERLGSLFVYRQDRPYGIDDVVLCEYGATVVGLEMSHSINEESKNAQRELRDVKFALDILSATEKKAMRCVLREMNGTEDLLITSRIADRAGITRSIVVNSLRKLEFAGIIEVQSSGMKGTHIKVLNKMLLNEIG